MNRDGLFPLLLLVIALAACGEQEIPTTPTTDGERPLLATAGHRVVNSAADPGNGVCNAAQCTLREAINDPASTEISFAPGLSGPITLAKPADGGGQLLINKVLTITGPASGLTIRRRKTDPQFRILRVDAGGDVTLTNLTLQNGSTNGGGGGVINTGSLALVNTAVSDNSAHQGGGIYNSGLLSLTNSFTSRNSADFGAGIDNHGRLTLERSSITSNSGGGIFNHDNQ